MLGAFPITVEERAALRNLALRVGDWLDEAPRYKDRRAAIKAVMSALVVEAVSSVPNKTRFIPARRRTF